LTNDWIRKRLEWICKNFLKVLDYEMDFMYRCGFGCREDATRGGGCHTGHGKKNVLRRVLESVEWRRVPQEGCLVYLVRHQHLNEVFLMLNAIR
jgi:hypothetical protein